MFIVGERINTSRKGIEPAVRQRDAAFVENEAKLQVAAGANMVDVNCGTLLEAEPEALAWLVKTVQGAVDVPLCLDSPNPAALAQAAAVHRGKPLINSLSGEEARYRQVIPIVREYKASIVALTMDDEKMPVTAADRLRVTAALVDRLTADGVALDDIYLDPLVQPVSTDSAQAMAVIETIATIRREYPGIHMICGLSNVSFGLPERKLLNRTFLAMCAVAGLDAVICDPLDREMMRAVYAADALTGRDDCCLDYLCAYREDKLKLK